MIPARKIAGVILFLAMAGGILSSCAALDMFKGSGSTGDPAAEVQNTEDLNGQPAMADEAPAAQEEQAAMDALQNKVSMLENKVNTLEGQVAGQKKIVYTMEYSDPAQLYKKARNLMLEDDIENAADLFATFAKEHPEHGLADNAMYWLGECHYTKGRYDQSIVVFKDLVKRYPKAEKVPDALLKTGYAYLSLDDVNRASHFLTLVIKKYPFSPAAEKAQEKLSTFQ